MCPRVPPVPKPVHDDLFESNVTAWMLQTQQSMVQGAVPVSEFTDLPAICHTISFFLRTDGLA